MPPKTGTSKKEQAAQTRRRLIKLARKRLAAAGYAGLATEALVAEAGLTRGALYHQFKSKHDLFEAVFLDCQAEVVAAIQLASQKALGPWAMLKDGCRAFVETASRPGISRIVLVDGPAVLGWKRWREIDFEYGIRELIAGLRELANAGITQPGNLEVQALLLSGAMNEAALWVSQSKKRKQALKEALENFDYILNGLRHAD